MVLISNAPRPCPEVAVQLDGLGVPREAWSALVTSGDVTRTLLAERAPGPAYRIGPERDAPLYDGLGLDFSPLDKARFIACTGPIDDEVETPEDYRALLTRRRGAASADDLRQPGQGGAARRPAGLLRRRAGRALRDAGRRR